MIGSTGGRLWLRTAVIVAAVVGFAIGAYVQITSDDEAEPVEEVAETTPANPATDEVEDATASDQAEENADSPGGYGFDRSDPEAGVANIMDAFATDQTTAACIYDAWGDVANVAPAELTPELMTFPICGTSIFELMTGDGRFTGQDDG